MSGPSGHFRGGVLKRHEFEAKFRSGPEKFYSGPTYKIKRRSLSSALTREFWTTERNHCIHVLSWKSASGDQLLSYQCKILKVRAEI